MHKGLSTAECRHAVTHSTHSTLNGHITRAYMSGRMHTCRSGWDLSRLSPSHQLACVGVSSALSTCTAACFQGWDVTTCDLVHHSHRAVGHWVQVSSQCPTPRPLITPQTPVTWPLLHEHIQILCCVSVMGPTSFRSRWHLWKLINVIIHYSNRSILWNAVCYCLSGVFKDTVTQTVLWPPYYILSITVPSKNDMPSISYIHNDNYVTFLVLSTVSHCSHTLVHLWIQSPSHADLLDLKLMEWPDGPCRTNNFIVLKGQNIPFKWFYIWIWLLPCWQ